MLTAPAAQELLSLIPDSVPEGRSHEPAPFHAQPRRVSLVTPDTSTFDPAPTPGFFEYAVGTEDGNIFDPCGPLGDVPDAFTTNDTFEKFGSTTNDYATVTGFTVGPSPTIRSTIDYLQFGGGYATEFVYEAGTPTPLTDLLITPSGDLTLFQL